VRRRAFRIEITGTRPVMTSSRQQARAIALVLDLF
jgi:hypothetical protein